MYTLVADGAPPITIKIGKGLAGACAQAKALVNVPDAYKARHLRRPAHPSLLCALPTSAPLGPMRVRTIASTLSSTRSRATRRAVCCVCPSSTRATRYPLIITPSAAHPPRPVGRPPRLQVIAVIQLINKVNGLCFGRADEELAQAFAAQLAVCIANLQALEDLSQALKGADARDQRLYRLLISCRELVTHTDTPLAICRRVPARPSPPRPADRLARISPDLPLRRRVRDYAAEFTTSMSAALLLHTDHAVGRGIAHRALGGTALERAVRHRAAPTVAPSLRAPHACSLCPLSLLATHRLDLAPPPLAPR